MNTKDTVEERLANTDSIETVCVLGLGYVGLPTAAVLAVNGLRVMGVDVNRQVVAAINAGEVPIEEVGLKTLVQAAVNSGNLSAAAEPAPADAFIIAVPTPIQENHEADLSYVEGAARSIVPHLRRGNLVVLESTSPPGTTDGLLTEILATSGLKPREDFYVAHCPERVLPGRILAELVENDRVIGGIDEESGRRAAALYARAIEGQVYITSAIAAELVKLFENAYRDVNVAFANELARVCRHWKADPWEVISLANRHPRVNILNPGPGVGGHCIPVDPWFIITATPGLAPLAEAARHVNDSQPLWVTERVLAEVSHISRPRVSVWGVAYKGNVDDARETPARHVIEALQAGGAEVSVVDLRVRRFPYPLDDLETSVTGADCVLLLTDHREFTLLDPQAIGERMRTRLVFDTRNCLPRARWEEAGFRVVLL